MRRLILLLAAASSLVAAYNFGTGNKLVATAGTPVALSTSATAASWVSVQALSGNTGTICVGDANVSASATASLRRGNCLTAGQAAPFYASPQNVPYTLNSIFIDSTVNGEGVSYTYAY
jgi:hypothetical protein